MLVKEKYLIISTVRWPDPLEIKRANKGVPSETYDTRLVQTDNKEVEGEKKGTVELFCRLIGGY